MMTSRERVKAAIELQSPDRIPFTHVLFPGALWNHGQRLVDLLGRYRDDFGNNGFTIPPEPSSQVEEYVDEWGVTWQRLKGYTAGEVKKAALTSWDQWDKYQFPTEPPAHYMDSFHAGLSDPNRDWYALAGWFDLFERMKYIRGTEDVLCDLAEDRQELHELADKLVEWNMRGIARWIEAGADGVFLSDDWGSQNSLLISPKTWREFFKPRYKKMIDLLRDAGKHVFFHSCGYTVEVWDDLIDLGVNVLNIQHSIIPESVLREKLTGKVCIFSDPDRQRIMPRGTPEEVRDHIKWIVDTFAVPEGGLMHRGELAPDWSLENIEAMYEAFNEFGECPAHRCRIRC